MVKRFLAVLLSLTMVISFTVSAYAESSMAENNIVIENATDSGDQPAEIITEENEGDGTADGGADDDGTADGGTTDGGVVDGGADGDGTVDGGTTDGDAGDGTVDGGANDDGNAEVEGEQPAETDPVCPGDDTCTIEGCQNHGSPAPAQTCEYCGVELTDGAVHAEDCLTLCTCTPVDGEHQEGCALYVEPSVFEQLLEIDTLKELFDAVMANSSDVYGFAYDELMDLKDHTEALYAAIDEPTADDDEYYDLLVETFVTLAVCPECGGEMGEHEEDCAIGQAEALATENWSGNHDGGTYTGTNIYTLTGNVTLKGTIKISSGTTTIRTNGSTRTIFRDKDFKGILFEIADGASLVIDGTNGKIIIDSQSVADTREAISCNEHLTLTNVTIKNNISGAGTSHGYAGAIEITTNTTANSAVNITDCIIQGCYATAGSGIYLRGGGCANVTVRRTIIEDCHYRVASNGVTDLGGTIRTNGDGGFTALFEDCVVRNNTSSSFAGGGFYWNACDTDNGKKSPKLTICDCQIYGNSAGQKGGGLFLEGNNTTIEATTTGTPSALLASNSYAIPADGFIGTRIENNSAPRGGGINFKTYANNNEIPVNNTVVTFGENVFIRNNQGDYGAGVGIDLQKTPNYSDTDTVLFQFNIAGAVIENNNVGSAGGSTVPVQGGGIYIDILRDNYDVDVNILSGTVQNNKAQYGGAVYIGGYDGDIKITTGDIKNNVATVDGGAFYISYGNCNMHNGTVKNNTAADGAGGAVYVGNGNFTMGNGTVTLNNAKNGGAVYVDNGEFTMTNGSITANTATVNGGGVYVAGGNVLIKHGVLNNNSATDGGAVYIDGDEDTTLRFESGQMNENSASDDGGAIFATNGTLYIGLEGCKAEATEAASKSCTHHGEGRYHPQIQKNEAKDTGGGIAIEGEGVVHFYCGTATENTALSKGVGMNVFMQGGKFYFYDATNVGIPRDPDLVIVGGYLYNECQEKNLITLNYYQTNDANAQAMQGFAQYEEVMNLTDAMYFWPEYEEDNDVVFIGWTAKGASSGTADEYVRHKEQYVASGRPVEILDHKSKETDEAGLNTNRLLDGNSTDKTMNLYALWAPKTNKITYMDSLDGNTSTASYNTNKIASGTIEVPATKSGTHSGFAIVGWYLYQDEGKNANWCEAKTTNCASYEPKYQTGTEAKDKGYQTLDYSADGMMYYPLAAPNGTLTLDVPAMTFGNITLVADYALVYSDLTITKQGAQNIDENQAFIFDVASKSFAAEALKGNINQTLAVNEELNALSAINMQVVIEGNGSIVIKHLPLGTYTVTENSDWSWRYGTTSSDPANGQVTLGLNDPKTITFTNTRTKTQWLSGDWYTENWWTTTAIRKKEDYIDPTKPKTE